MCESRLRHVVSVESTSLVVDTPSGRRERVSLLAYEGAPLQAGDVVVVHSGYALASVDAEEAAVALAELAELGSEGPRGRPTRSRARGPDAHPPQLEET